MSHSKRTLVCVLAGWVLVGAGLAHAQDWPQWRGPNRDNKVVGFSEPKTWPKELTKKWKVTVGIGEASPLLVGDKLYVFARQGGDEVTRCLDAATGKEIWIDRYAAVAVKGAASGYPGPRSTPAVGEGKVCTLGVGGVLSCLDAASGKIIWRKETGEKPTFYTSSSPIIADGKCIVFLDTLDAFDLASGEAKWKWSGGGTPYGSPVLMTVDGVKTVVTPSSNLLAGVKVADGTELWRSKLPPGGYQVSYSTPLVGDAMVYYSVAGGGFGKGKFGKGGKGGKGGGGNMLAFKIDKQGDKFNASEAWTKPTAAAGYHTPVLADGRIFGVSAAGRAFFCLDAKTGEPIWADKTARGQCGSILSTGTVMLALTSDKDLVAFRPTGKTYTEVAKYRVSDEETWCVPIIADNRVYVKDKGGSLALWTIE